MASEEAVQAFLEAAQLREQYSTITQSVATMMAQQFEARGDATGAAIAEGSSNMYALLEGRVMTYLATIYGEFFTDKELLELAELHSSPIFQKARDLAPGISGRMSEMLMADMDEINVELDAMFGDNSHDVSGEDNPH